jgi:hypothetical protein
VHDRAAAEFFQDTYVVALSSEVRWELRNKLATGLKRP